MLVTIIIVAIICIFLFAIVSSALDKGDTTVSQFSTAQLPVGAACHRDNECANGACGRPGADTALACCDSGHTSSYWFHDYCTGLPQGTPCWTDAMCGKGSCEGVSGFTHGTCK